MKITFLVGRVEKVLRGRAILLTSLMLSMSALLYGQQPEGLSNVPTSILNVTSTHPVPLTSVGDIYGQIRCDVKGNVYFETQNIPLLRVSADGHNVVSFSTNPIINSRLADFRQDSLNNDFAINPSGGVYVVTRSRDNPYVLSFDSDGRYQSMTRLDGPASFHPLGLAVFANGNFLVSGTVRDTDKEDESRPLTAIFESGGRLVSELSLQGDKEVRKLQSSLDTDAPEIHIVGIMMSDDGNAYVMRRLKKPVVEVVSPSGELLRTLRIMAPEGFSQGFMTTAHDSFFITFYKSSKQQSELLYVKYDSADGHEIARFERSKDIVAAFVCYAREEFLFIDMRDEKITLVKARP